MNKSFFLDRSIQAPLNMCSALCLWGVLLWEV